MYMLVHTVYRSLGYTDIVASAAEASMNLAVGEIKELPDYAQNGEVCHIIVTLVSNITQAISVLQWVITDARHDSTANAYHTTVPCLSGRSL